MCLKLEEEVLISFFTSLELEQSVFIVKPYSEVKSQKTKDLG